MNGFAILVSLLIAGVVGGCKRVEVKRGKKVLVENKFGLENINRVALYNASKDCNQKGLGEISYCSPKENESGCTNKNGSTFSFDIGKDSVSLTPLNASDGFYVVSIIDIWSNVTKILIVVNGELPSTDPPSQENPEANSTKGTETPGTDDLSTLGFAVGIAVGIAVGFAVGIIVGIAVGIAVGNTVGNAVGIAVGILVWCCLKKKKNESKASDCKKDPKKIPRIESNIKAGEQTTGDSFEMVDGDRIPHSEDDNLKEVLIVDDTSVEHGRPGHNYSDDDDDDDDNSKHNNTTNYCDYCNFCSNDEDDDVILSNNTNNYVN